MASASFIAGALGAAASAKSVLSTMSSQNSQKSQMAYYQQLQDRRLAEQRQAREIEERRRKEQLKKAVASHRARMGSAGFDASSGSAGALVQGLEKQLSNQFQEERSLVNQRYETDLLSPQNPGAGGNNASALINAIQKGLELTSLFR